MRKRKIVSGSLATLFTLTLTGLAVARQPPALQAEQAATLQRIACDGVSPESSGGYRDLAVRFGSQTTTVSPKAVAGYRGHFVKGGTEGPAVHVACSPSTPRLSAAR